MHDNNNQYAMDTLDRQQNVGQQYVGQQYVGVTACCNNGNAKFPDIFKKHSIQSWSCVCTDGIMKTLTITIS